ncbi:MAG: enoyl-CoA hydratase [Burkholderiales bacterium]
MSAHPGRVHSHIDGPIGWIVFDNPGRHNAMSVAMWEALPAAVDALTASPQVRVIVLRGEGDQAFVSGADISQFDQVRDSLEANQRYEALGNAGMSRVADCPKPTIAMLQGWCLGGGMAITLNCDLRIADESLRYGIPAARLGIGYRWPGIRKLVDTVGAPNAREIFLTARRFTSQDALRMGFVNRVVPRGELETAVRAECALLAANAPLTMASVKIAIDEITRAGPHIDAARIEEATRRAYESQDFIEGRQAFMQKRAPVFQGR